MTMEIPVNGDDMAEMFAQSIQTNNLVNHRMKMMLRPVTGALQATWRLK